MEEKTYLTEFKAINPLTGDLETWAGPDIKATDEIRAFAFIQELGLNYLKIVGEKVESVEHELTMDALLEFGNREN